MDCLGYEEPMTEFCAACVRLVLRVALFIEQTQLLSLSAGSLDVCGQFTRHLPGL